MSNSPGRSACPYAGRSAKDFGEVRTELTQGRIARVLFCVHDSRMVLLQAFIKKTQKTPDADIEFASSATGSSRCFGIQARVSR